MKLKISDKLAQPQVSHYIEWLGRVGYRNVNCTMAYTDRSYELMDELFALLKKLKPVSKSGAKQLWLCARRGNIEDFAKSYGEVEDLIEEGQVKDKAQYEEYWKETFPNEYEWYEMISSIPGKIHLAIQKTPIDLIISPYAGLSGYTEYHASQVELVQLLGAKTIDTAPSFSMNMIISTFAGDKSVLQYVQEKYQHAIDLFSRADFPANINTLKSALGVLYNYWGLRSICEMYATDFVETIDNGVFTKFIPTVNFTLQNNLMHGWLDKAKIDLSIPLYVNTIFPIIRDYKLA